ncbi:LysM peptidoglycan-binding domain-containing protein [Fodinicola acaciae]|uniref:LysM peptidoglycan-binding domain-containing protein n=1 Tax=Fodinicola acaciae TaxID=2681555 RepID=UPI0013D0E52F|nr:LysM peptidoglycan-binding domain-containing protein [Fodinicola acaciae]
MTAWRFAARMLRAALAVAVLLGLVVLPPTLLLAYVPLPPPDHPITWDDILTWSSYLSTADLIGRGATCLGWISWFMLSIYLIVHAIGDAIAHIRALRNGNRYQTPHGIIRASISTLVGLVIAAAVSRGAFAAAYSDNTRTGAYSTAVAQPQPEETDVVTGYGSPLTAGHWYQVKKGDTLSAIADKTYGAEKEWPRIWHANRGRHEPEGVVFTNPNHIRPLWRLWLPRTQSTNPHRVQPRSPQPSHTPARPMQPTEKNSPRPATRELTSATPSPLPGGDSVEGHLNLPDGGWLVFGAAAVIGAALIMAIRRRRRFLHYRELDHAAEPADELTSTLTRIPPTSLRWRAPSERTASETAPIHGPLLPIAVNTAGETVYLDQTAMPLRLTGEGAYAVVRAIIATVGAAGRPSGPGGVQLLTDSKLLSELLVPHAPPWSSNMTDIRVGNAEFRLAVDADKLLDLLEDAVIARRRLSLDRDPRTPAPGPLVVVLASSAAASRRLTAMLAESGRHRLAIHAVILDDHHREHGCVVDSTGRVSPGPAGPISLANARASTLPAAHLAQILARLEAGSGTAAQGVEMRSRQATTPPGLPSKQMQSQKIVEPTSDPHETSDSLDASAGAQSVCGPTQSENSWDVAQHAHQKQPRLALSVLGRFELHDPDGEQVPPPGGKGTELLVVLALHREGVPLGELTATLWPEYTRERGRNALSTVLARVRRQLRVLGIDDDAVGLNPIAYEGGRYSLDPRVWAVDLWKLRDLVDRLGCNPHDTYGARSALRLYRGHLDAAGAPADWICIHDDKITALLARTLGSLAEHHLDASGDRDLAAAIAAHLVDLNPDNESLYMLWMRTEAGHPTAIRAIRDLATRRLADLSVLPSTDLLNLADELAGMPQNLHLRDQILPAAAEATS